MSDEESPTEFSYFPVLEWSVWLVYWVKLNARLNSRMRITFRHNLIKSNVWGRKRILWGDHRHSPQRQAYSALQVVQAETGQRTRNQQLCCAPLWTGSQWAWLCDCSLRRQIEKKDDIWWWVKAVILREKGKWPWGMLWKSFELKHFRIRIELWRIKRMQRWVEWRVTHLGLWTVRTWD